MRIPDFDELLSDAGEKVSYPSQKFEAWLKRRGVLEENTYISGYAIPKNTVYAGGYDFLSQSEVIATNTDEAGGIPKPLDDGLLIIGSCANGDLVAVDVRDKPGVVGIINHELVWEDVPVRDIFIRVAKSLDDLAKLMFRGKAPGDYYEAEAERARQQRARKKKPKKRKGKKK